MKLVMFGNGIMYIGVGMGLVVLSVFLFDLVNVG